MLERKTFHRSSIAPVTLMALGLLWFIWALGVGSQGWRSLFVFAPLALVPLGADVLATGRLSWRVFFLALILVALAMMIGAAVLFVPPVVTAWV